MDNRIRIRKGKQTVRITVTITAEQHAALQSLAQSSGFNASEIVRYALIQLFRQPLIVLPGEHTGKGHMSREESTQPGLEHGGQAAAHTAITGKPSTPCPATSTEQEEEDHAN